jgi:DNA polymerase-3 subunit delta
LLLVSCEQWDESSRKSKWAKALGDAGVRVDIWPIKAHELPDWLEQRMQRQGLRPEPEALRILAERLEGNLLAAAQEIDRMALLKGAGPVSADDVERAVADASRFNAFVLAEHMLAGDLRDGLRVAAGLKRMGEPIQPLVGALLNELKTTEAFRLAMRSGESTDSALRRLRIWFRRKQTIPAAARRLNTRALYDAYELLALIDRQGKGRAAGDPWHTVDQLLLRLAA